MIRRALQETSPRRTGTVSIAARLSARLLATAGTGVAWAETGPRRKRSLVAVAVLAAAVGVSAATARADTEVQTRLVYDYTGGEQTFVVPPGVTTVHAEVYGARGGDSEAELPAIGVGDVSRALVAANIDVFPGQVLYVEVGGDGGLSEAFVDSDGHLRYTAGEGGWNGGAPGAEGGGGGGGATDIRLVSRVATQSLQTRVIASGGGGGGALRSAQGGSATNSGEDGLSDASCFGARGGGGGLGSFAGEGGRGQFMLGSPFAEAASGQNGQLGLGGSGGAFGGGGGGGGHYGGGGGGGGLPVFRCSFAGGHAGGGGGGSNLGQVVGDPVSFPYATITYTGPPPGADPSSPPGTSTPATAPTGERAAALKKCKKKKSKKARRKCRRKARSLPL